MQERFEIDFPAAVVCELQSHSKSLQRLDGRYTDWAWHFVAPYGVHSSGSIGRNGSWRRASSQFARSSARCSDAHSTTSARARRGSSPSKTFNPDYSTQRTQCTRRSCWVQELRQEIAGGRPHSVFSCHHQNLRACSAISASSAFQ
jgi:hypothetical protein